MTVQGQREDLRRRLVDAFPHLFPPDPGREFWTPAEEVEAFEAAAPEWLWGRSDRHAYAVRNALRRVIRKSSVT